MNLNLINFFIIFFINVLLNLFSCNKYTDIVHSVSCCCCCCRPHSTNVLPAESSTRNHVAASSLSPQVARKGSTLSGFVQRSRLEREVGRDLHSNKWEEVWSCIRQSGQSGEGCRGSPMKKRYETRSGDLFVRSWARVRRVSLDRRSSAGDVEIACHDHPLHTCYFVPTVNPIGKC